MINYELKNTTAAKVSLKDNGDAKIVQGFTVGAVGTPTSYKMLAGDTIEIIVQDYANKTVEQVNIEVISAVNAFIAEKYPPTGN